MCAGHDEHHANPLTEDDEEYCAVTFGEHEPHGPEVSDPHSLLFGPSEQPDAVGEREHHVRMARRHHRRRRRNRRVFVVMGLSLLGMFALAVWLIVIPIYRHFNPADYSGPGSGQVIVDVHQNDSAQAIGKTLQKAGVVASVRAFTDAASSDARSTTIQPGSYSLRKHISAKQALAELLDPKNSVGTAVVVPEGATIVDIEKRLTAARCTASSPKNAVCGLALSADQVKAALKDVAALGLPTDYLAGGRTPPSAEGFLYPATYPFDAGTSATDALRQMVSSFTDQVRATNFTADSKPIHVSAYQALIIASIAQSEAYFPEDMPKVARVILNRLAAQMPLQIDATSAYAAKLAGLDPATVIYSEVNGPYNTYKHAGLPPTPISNPGQDALDGAVHPDAGDWLYYVNADAAGHLFFTNDEKQFEQAVAKCRANHWGCG